MREHDMLKIEADCALGALQEYISKQVTEIDRLNEVLASIRAATDLETARRRAYDGRTP